MCLGNCIYFNALPVGFAGVLWVTRPFFSQKLPKLGWYLTAIWDSFHYASIRVKPPNNRFCNSVSALVNIHRGNYIMYGP